MGLVATIRLGIIVFGLVETMKYGSDIYKTYTRNQKQIDETPNDGDEK